MPPKVTEAYKEEKRAAILEGAMRCFEKKGYQATTIEDIVRYLGSSKGAIYTYFSSKEEIFIQLMQERTKRSMNDLKRQFDDIPDASGKIRLILRRFREASLEMSRLYGKVHYEFWLYSSRQENLKKLMVRRFDEAMQFLAEIVTEGKQKGEFREDVDERIAASLFWALRDGVGLHFAVTGEEAAHQAVWAAAEEMFFRYLKE
jgi:AcrR family transcriptional regulator